MTLDDLDPDNETLGLIFWTDIGTLSWGVADVRGACSSIDINALRPPVSTNLCLHDFLISL